MKRLNLYIYFYRGVIVFFKYLVYIFDISIVALGLYSIFVNGLDFVYLLYSISLTVFILIYGYVAYNIGMGFGNIKEFVGEFAFLQKYGIEEFRKLKSQRQKNFIRFKLFCTENIQFFIKVVVDKKLISLSTFVYLSMFFSLGLYVFLPTMWFYLIVYYLSVLLYYVKIIINGIIDIALKRYFYYYWDKSNGSYNEKGGYKIFCWLIKYPILRMMFYPLYVRSRIIDKDFKGIARTRILGYFFAIYLLFIGYKDVIIYLKCHYIILILVVYIYFALIQVLIIYFETKVSYQHRKWYLYPEFYLIFGELSYRTYTMSLFIITTILDIDGFAWYDEYIQFFVSDFRVIKPVNLILANFNRSYKLFRLNLNVYEWKKLFITNYKIGCFYGQDYYMENPVTYEIEDTCNYFKYKNQINLGRYEKYYYIPCFVYNELHERINVLKMLIMLEGIGQEGIARYGVMFMHYEYGDVYEQALEFFKCWLFFIFDLQRLCGVSWDENKLPIENLYKFRFDLNIEDVPDKFSFYNNIKLYKDIINLLEFFLLRGLRYKFNIAYMPRLFVSYISGFYKLLNRDDYDEKIYVAVAKSLKNVVFSVIEDFSAFEDCTYPGWKISLMDRLELDTPKFFLYYDIYNFEYLVNNKKLNTIKTDRYIQYLQKDFINNCKKEYDLLLKTFGCLRTVSISKNCIKLYKKNYFNLDFQHFDDFLYFNMKFKIDDFKDSDEFKKMLEKKLL